MSLDKSGYFVKYVQSCQRPVAERNIIRKLPCCGVYGLEIMNSLSLKAVPQRQQRKICLTIFQHYA